MQDDVEFGFRQIVDIALKALSPAVNDPSTAATCIDQLGRLLIRAVGRRMGPVVVATGGGHLVLPAPTFTDLLDLAVEQIRQYGRADMATALRLLRVLAELRALTTDPEVLARLRSHADRIREAGRASFAPEDTEELERRYASVRVG